MSDRHKRKLRVILIAGIIFAVLFIAFAILRAVRIGVGIKKMKEEQAIETQAKEPEYPEIPISETDPE